MTRSNHRKLAVLAILVVLGAFPVIAQDVVSVQPGPWNDLNTWSLPIIPTSANTNSITINHAVSVPNGFSVTVDGTIINSTLTVAGALTIAAPAASVVVNGTLVAQNTATLLGSNGSNIVFNSGATYEHAYTTLQGSAPLAQWHANSTVLVSGFTTGKTMTALGNWSQLFGNFTFNCPAMANHINFAGLLTSVAGNLQVLSTGVAIVYFSSTQTYNLVVGGTLLISGTSRVNFSTSGSPSITTGQDFQFNSTNGSGSATSNSGNTVFNITRDFLVNAPGGVFRLGYTAFTGSPVFNVGRHMTMTAGTLLEASDDPGVSTFNFTNGASHSFTNTGTIQNNVHYVVGLNDILTIVGESPLVGGISSSLDLAGQLVVNSAHANGAIQIGNGASPVGNIWVQNRTYQAGSIITYGGSSPQAIGNGQPSGANVITRISNAAGVSLNYASISTVVIGDLEVVSGTLTITNNSLDVQTLSTQGGSVALTPTSTTRTLTVNEALQLTNGSISVTSGATTADITINGDILAGAGSVGFSGGNNRITIGGSGNFSNPFPFTGVSTVRTINITRGGGGTLMFDQNVTTTDLTINSGNLDVNTGRTLTVLNNLNINTGSTLFFEGATLEIQRQFNNTLTGGVLSSSNTSILNITGSATLGTLAFSGGGNTLQTLTINRIGVGTLVTLNSALNIASALNILDGVIANVSGLSMNSGSTISVTPNGSFAAGSVAPMGGPYNVTYNDGTAPVSASLTSGAEAQGNVNDMNVNLSGTLTAGTTMTVNGTLFLNAGTFANSSSRLTMGGSADIVRNSNSAPMTVSAPLGGPYDLIYNGTSLTNGRESFGSLNDFTINSSGTVTISSNMTVGGTVTQNSGILSITASRLIMGNGATFNRFSGTTVSGTSPGGGPYNVLYSGTSLTTQFEATGLVSSINSQVSGTVTQGSALNITFALTVESGTWTSGANTIAAAALINESVFNAPSTTMTLTANLVNDVTYNHNGGTVVFNGISNLPGANSVTFFGLQVNSGSTLNAPAAFGVEGDIDFPVGAIFNASTGTVNLTGSSAQNLDVNGTRFHGITINKSGGAVTLASGLNLGGVLAINSATTFDSGGFLTVLSQPDGPGDDVGDDGSIGPIASGGSVANNVIVQRFMLTKGRNNKYVSPPVSGVLLADITDDMTVDPGFWRKYNEAQSGTASLGYVNLNSGDFPLTTGRGYLAFLDDEVDIMWDVTGPIHAGDVALPVTYTNSTPTPRPNDDGWNLVGNPYPSPIQWNNNAAAWTRSNVDPVATVYETVGSSVANGGTGVTTNIFTYNFTNGTGNLPNGQIATGQAFWVHLSAAGSLTVKEPAKLGTAGGRFLRQRQTIEQLTISLAGDGFMDHSFLVVDPGASKGYDQDLDGIKYINEFGSIYFSTDYGRKLVMNAVDYLNGDEEFPLTVFVSSAGEYRIRFSGLDQFSESDNLYFIDAASDVVIPINEMESKGYPVVISNPSKPVENRFFLSYKRDVNKSNLPPMVIAYPNPVRDQLKIEAGSQKVLAANLVDATGNLMSSFSFNEDLTIDMRSIPNGVYFLKIMTTGGVVIRKIVKHN